MKIKFRKLKLYPEKVAFLIFLSLLISCSFYSNRELTIVAVGDIMLGRGAEKDLSKKKVIFPFEKIQSFTSTADICFGNLESPISSRGRAARKKYCFRASTPVVQGLSYAGFDILSLANNHSLDYGPEALLNTIQILKRNHILCVGAGKNLDQARKAVVFSIKKNRIVFLAYNSTFPESFYANIDKPGIAPSKLKFIRQDIEQNKKSDIVVVSFHWGEEYTETPTEKQRKLAHLAIDSGADLVLGHHPHVIQGLEFYKKKLIVYSLGNFIFDQRFGNTSKSFILKCVFAKKKLSKAVIIPIIRTYGKYYPQPARDKEKREIIDLLVKRTLSIDSDIKRLRILRFEG